jgi:hypothetical protein
LPEALIELSKESTDLGGKRRHFSPVPVAPEERESAAWP